MVRVLTSHQICGLGLNPGVGTIICGSTHSSSLLLFLSFAPRGFSPGTSVFPSPQKPTFPNSDSTRSQVNKEPLCGCATYHYYLSITAIHFIDTQTKYVHLHVTYSNTPLL